MAWYQAGDKPFSKPVMTQIIDVYVSPSLK